MSTYRCQGCGQYHRGEPHRRFGLGAVCSEECITKIRKRRGSRPPTPPDQPLPSIRAAVLARDQGCRFCGTQANLHVHHIRYRSQGLDHTVSNLIVLCREHHDLVHSDKRRWQPACQAYIEHVVMGRRRYLAEIDRELRRSTDAGP